MNEPNESGIAGNIKRALTGTGLVLLLVGALVGAAIVYAWGCAT